MVVWLGELLAELVGAVVDWLGKGTGRTDDDTEENEIHESRPSEE
jgi:hypothetical protein